MASDLKVLQDSLPFLTLFKYANEEYVGIVQNQGKTIVSVYIYNLIHGDDLKRKFIKLGETWWWESNRKVPINLFLKEDFQDFEFCLRSFNNKEFEVIQGPTISLQNLNEKRVKRRRIELIRE